MSVHYFIPDMGLTIGTCVVVKELSEGGNAHKSGVKLGDQLLEVEIANASKHHFTLNGNMYVSGNVHV